MNIREGHGRSAANRLACLLLLGFATAGLALILFQSSPAAGAPVCTITWDGGAGTASWHTATNWRDAASGADRLPASTDVVCIPDTSITAVTVSQSVTISNLQSEEAITLSGGTFTITDSVNPSVINKPFTWSGGAKGGAGKLTAAGGLTISGTATKTLTGGGSIENTATAVVTGTGTVVIANGSTFGNLAGGTVDVQANMTFRGGGTSGTGTISNAGTFRKSGGTGVTQVIASVRLLAFDNSGTVDVRSGTLKLASGGTSGGAFTVASGATLEFGGGEHTLAASTNVSGAGSVRFSGGSGATVTFPPGSIYDVGGATTVAGGKAVTFGNEVTSLGSTLAVSAGSVAFSQPMNLAVPVTLSGGTLAFRSVAASTLNTLTWSGGLLSNNADLTVGGAMIWSGGTKVGAGKLTAAGGLTISGAAGKGLKQGTFDNAGAAKVTGAGIVYIYNGATFTNLAGATFDVQVDMNFQGYCCAASTFHNQGTFIKSGGTGANGTLFVRTAGYVQPITFKNSGTVRVQTGRLRLDGAGNSTDPGSWNVAAGATLEFGNATRTLADGASVTGAGDVLFSTSVGKTTFAAGSIYNIGGTTTVAGGNVVFQTDIANLGSSFTVSSGRAAFMKSLTTGTPITLSGGTLAFGVGTTSTLNGSMTWSRGQLATSGTVAANGPITWSGGTKSGVGRLRANGGLTISGTANKAIVGGAVDNAGTATATGTGAFFIYNQGSSFNNLEGAIFDDQVNLTFSGKTACCLRVRNGTFINAGTFRKSGGTGTTTFAKSAYSSVNFKQTASGNLVLRIGGLTAGTQFDRIAVGGSTTLGGQLTLEFINGFTPEVGNQFLVMPFGLRVGTFAGVTSPFTAIYNRKDVTLVYGVAPTTAAPAVAVSPTATTIDEGATFAGAGSFTDPDSTSWTGTVDWGDGSDAEELALGPDKTFTLNHIYAVDGIYTVTVSITDDQGGSGSATATVTVNDKFPNSDPPIIAIGSNATVNEGDTFLRNGSFTDEDSSDWTATVDWGDDSDAEDLDLNEDQAFTLAHVYTDNGAYAVTVTITDDEGVSQTAHITVTVTNVAPAVDAGPDQTVDAGDAVELVPATFTDPGESDTYTATIDWGDGTVEAGMVTGDSSSGAVDGSHIYASAGTYTVTVCVLDDDGGRGCDTFKVTANAVEIANEPPVVEDPGDQSNTEGDAVALSIEASDPEGEALTYSAAGLPGGLSIDPSTGVVSGTIDASAAGHHAVTVTVSDDVASVSASFTWVVAEGNQPPSAENQTAATNEDTAVAITLSGSDPDGDALSFSVVAQPANGTLSGTAPNLTYTPKANFSGSDSFTFKANDGKEDSNVATVAVTVTPVDDAPTATEDSYAVDEDIVLTVAAPGVLANDSDVESDPLTAVLVTGPSNGTLTLNADGSFTYTPAANFNGSDSFTYKANDGAADSSVATVSIVVAPVNDRPAANAGGPYTGQEGGAVSFAGSATDVDAGDTLAYRWDFGDGTVTDFGPSPNATHTYVDDGAHTATLTVKDGAGATATSAADVTIANVTPTVGPIAAPLDPQAVSTAITAGASFTDPGAADLHTAVWAWGDGTTSVGAVTEANGSGSVSGGHAYAAAGVYTVTLTVTDDDRGAGTSTFQYVVVYDAAAGFLTGGGWIDSPAGACKLTAACVGAIGKASFGFVSKYEKGATVPTGNTEFQFRAGNLNFQGTAYDWLVIAGPKGQYKGSGTINGQGDYGFLLTATDGQVAGGGGVDKFRIKIWDKATGAIVYDNQMGATDDADPTTAIGGGSIVIHK